jgi:hypothetical protein
VTDEMPVTHEYEVQATMTVRAESEMRAIEGAQRWLPYQRELPLGCSDEIVLTGVSVGWATVKPS